MIEPLDESLLEGPFEPMQGAAILTALFDKVNEMVEELNAVQQFVNREHMQQPPFPPVVPQSTDWKRFS